MHRANRVRASRPGSLHRPFLILVAFACLCASDMADHTDTQTRDPKDAFRVFFLKKKGAKAKADKFKKEAPKIKYAQDYCVRVVAVCTRVCVCMHRSHKEAIKKKRR